MPALALTACALAPASAQAEPIDLSDPAFNSSFPVIAIDPQGNTTVGFGRENGPNASMGSVVFRPGASAAYTSPLDLPSADGLISSVKRIAVGAEGDVAVSTVNRIIAPARFQVRVRRPGQPFSAWISASSDGQGQFAHDGDIVVTPQGDVVAVWKQDTGTNAVIQTATLAAGATAFTAPVNLSVPSARNQDDGYVDVAVNPRGDIAAAWTRAGGNPQFNRLQVAFRPAGAPAFEPKVDVSSALGSAFRPTVAVDGQGGTTVAWEQLGLFGDATAPLQVAARPVGEGSFRPPQVLTLQGTSANDARLAIAAQGVATLVWSRSVPFDLTTGQPSVIPDKVEVSTRPAGADAFSPRVGLSDGLASAREPKVAVNAAGDVAIAWERGFERVQVVRRSADADAFSAPQTLSPNLKGRHPELAVGPDGDMTAVWACFDDDGGIIRAEDIDTTAPSIADLDVPTSAAAGAPVAVTVRGVDRLSALAPASWAFGDGGTATGDRVAHAYAQPGTYAVRVTVADAVGNTATAARPMVVGPPAPGAGAAAPGAGAQTAARRRDTTAPRILRARLTPVRVRPAARGGGLAAKALGRGVGTTLRFTASEASRLGLTVERRVSGRRLGGRCGPARRLGPPCVVWRRLGALPSKAVGPGAVRLYLTGRLGGRTLAPGTYRLRLRLQDAAGNRSRSVLVRFLVVR